MIKNTIKTSSTLYHVETHRPCRGLGVPFVESKWRFNDETLAIEKARAIQAQFSSGTIVKVIKKTIEELYI